MVGCGGPDPRVRTPEPASPAIRFEDAAERLSVRFRHQNGAAGRKWMPETMGSGCAVLDANADGRPDLLFVDGTPWPGDPGPPGQSRLFLQLPDGRFTDSTRQFRLPAGLIGMGAAVADYDNDGFQDLVVTALNGSRLLRNRGGLYFEDVTARWNLRTAGWPTSAAWLDYDRDGLLDLFLCSYVNWTPSGDLFATLDGTHKTYARPDEYTGGQCRLFRQQAGRFVEVSAAAGVAVPNAKALGVALCDFDRDGWIDLAVSNDTVPNFLFHNQGNGTFKEVAVQAGVAVAEGGRAKAGMGIDVSDFANSGQDSILITNFSGEQLSLYQRDGSGLFQDVAARAGVGIPSQRYLGFGAFFFDADLDGCQEILVANGHIQRDIQHRSTEVTYAQPALLFHCATGGVFEDTSRTAGALATPRVARGAAYADLDGDGDLDVVVTTNGGPAAVLLQRGGPQNHWLRLLLEGRRSNRSAIGAAVRVRTGERVQTRMVRSGSSYLSQSEIILTFGLGAAPGADEVEVRWPNGNVESYGAQRGNQVLRLIERHTP